MKTNQLGKIKKVELRNAWNHEASDFTNWLAEEENLHLLGDELGIDIKLIQTEAVVGKFNVDILAEEESVGNKIIIENQLEATDHDHLGKIITYASGFEASTIIWIVKEAREEHRQAIDWLNEHTDDNLSFFLVQIELWQIGDSPLAPKFEIISKPNDWAKTIKQSSGGGKITETKARQLEFWKQFKSFIEMHKATFRVHQPSPQHWINISIGSSLAHISLGVNSFEDIMRAMIYIPDRKDLYHFLEQKKDEIEKEIGSKLVWAELPGKKASYAKIETSGSINNTEEWERYFSWMQEISEKLKRSFSKILKKYK